MGAITKLGVLIIILGAVAGVATGAERERSANEPRKHYGQHSRGCPERLEQRVFKIVADQLGVRQSDVTTGSRFIEDLGADSLDFVELIMAIEEEFGTEISDAEADNITTVGEVISYLRARARCA